MSKKYNSRDTFPYAFLMFVLLLVLLPVVPACIAFSLLLFIFKIRGTYSLIVSITSISVVFIFNHNALQEFFNQMFAILHQNISLILQGHFFTLDSFFKYSPSSWFIILMIALCLASVYKMRKDRQKTYEAVGIKSLDKEVKEVKSEKETSKLPTTGVYLGLTESHKKIYSPHNSKHFLIGGTTGAGKTVALSNFIKSAMTENFPILLVDGKGDTGKNSILEVTKQFCQQYDRNLIVIDMSDPDHCSKYNPFQGVNATVATDMIVNMTDWSEEHYKSNTKRFLQRVCQFLIKNGDTLSFEKIIGHMDNNGFFSLLNELVEKNIITKSEHIENEAFYETVGEIAQGSFSRFATLAESEPGKIFTGDGINITSAMKNNDVILFVLNPLLYPETSALLGRLILIDSKQAVSSLFDSEIRKYFVFDEINVYASTVLLDLVNKSRSANVTCVLGTQSLADLRAISPEFKEQTIENCNNYMILRQNAPEGAEEWAKTIGTMETMKMTYQISNDTDEDTQKGSARRTREFIVHPDEIKNLAIGDGYFISRDFAVVEKIRVNKPF